MYKVLLVDDDQDFRLMLKKLLERNGYEVIDAANGIEALERFRQHQPKVVITDIIMPDMDGIETIIEIRKKYPGTKLIAISGGGRIGPTNYLNAARALGASKVLTKPFDNEELLKILADL
jgi:CheY-like chemotaxis protein